MKILRSLGLGTFFLVLLVFMPAVFFELSKTLVVFLRSSQQVFVTAGALASQAPALPSAP